jgi:molybdopterin converting factor small subunit
MNISLGSFFWPAVASKREIEIMYFGRPSEFLLMTSERMSIANEMDTLAQVLHRLRQRGDRWAYELDDRYVICTVNGKTALLSDNITVGDEMGIFSRRSWHEM